MADSKPDQNSGAPLEIGFLLFPGVTQLDFTGPAQVLSRVPRAHIHVVWKTNETVMTDSGFAVLPTDNFISCPPLDILIVPGGAGTLSLVTDMDVLLFLKKHAAKARYICSVCTGSLVLGAAGLLDGYKATCHWAWLDFLPHFGATPVAGRVVKDGNRITGGGVTAGIDFGLTLAADLVGENAAKLIQLSLEYDPQPPFDCGSPEKVGPERARRFKSRMKQRQDAFRAAIAQDPAEK